jgi:NTE family protein
MSNLSNVTTKKKLGLVLTGGGARAAYQVGVLRAIAHITGHQKNPFAVISGLSAGAINGAWLASYSENFDRGTKCMWETWSQLTADQIFKTGPFSLTSIAARWLKDRSLGGLQKRSQITYLLNTEPLRELIQTRINFDAINKYVETGQLHAFAVTAVDYRTGHSTAFYNGNKKIKNWEKLNRISVRTEITAEQVMASSAIPIFFPPVKIGDSYYGDGMVRVNTPLSPAIHLGADKLLVIGIRGPSSTSLPETPRADSITVGEIAGTILNGLFFDSIDGDLERLRRINRTLSVMTPTELAKQPDHLRTVPILALTPSQEVAELPACELSRLPLPMAFLLRGIGVSAEKGQDLLSYLAFEPKFINSLLELGYEDAIKKKYQILEFFETEAPKKRVTLSPQFA